MNETIEGRAPGGHGGDANGDREGVITLDSNKRDFVRRLITLQGKEIKPGSTQWETKPATEALPFEQAKVDFGLHSQTANYSRPWALHRKTVVVYQQNGGRKQGPQLPTEWTHLIHLAFSQ